MGTKHQSSSDPISDPKKKRRVGFSKIDAGVEANECIKIYLVSSKEEVGSPDSFCIKPVDLNHFFEEDGKIYGYQNLKITIWVSSISFHAYADISFESTEDGGKGITDLKAALQNVFAENLVEKKDEFLDKFSSDRQYVKSVISTGAALKLTAANGHNGDSKFDPKEDTADLEVFRIVGEPVGHLYSRLVPFVLLLIDGSNPIDVTDPRWEIYVMVEKAIAHQEDSHPNLIGFAAVYRFYRYPESMRLRLGQVLVLPPYQRKGYGGSLLKVLNNVAVSEAVYDLTVEEPEDSLQHVRTLIDVQCLLVFGPIQAALNSVVARLKQENFSKKVHSCQCGPPLSAVEDVRKSLKINRRQFLQCWEVLLYLGLDPIEKYLETYRTIVSSRIKADVIGKDSEGVGKRVIDVPTEYDQEASFVMYKSLNGDATNREMAENRSNQEEQLRQLVDERMKEIKLIAEKVSSLKHR
ncbi:histone acetyltransferase type B catalytic subunit-like isoform X1 [Coffea arabica]|uniref:histone acetyltransferase n=1 Tax=Coffea arabica TaxID=13443 RepID=A0A6P6SN22_COFAR|nr:histone acetyltransferase type B catalytic subunit-like [Coffea arabica]